MGGLFSSMFGWLIGDAKVGALAADDLGPDADIKDPASGLTPREVAYVKHTWELVRPDLKQHGIGFFLALFGTHPILQTRFKPFNGKSLEELRGNKRLAAHGTTVMTAIDSYISNLDDISCLVELLKTTGLNHKNRGVKKSDFELLVPILVKYLEDNLGSAWNAKARSAWQNLLNVVISVIFQGYDESN